MKNSPNIIIIGGGAAGMTAAITAAREGATVTILERTPRTGQKLRITGKGRCNLTNMADRQTYLTHIYPRPKFCYSMFSRFFTEETLDFFRGLGIETVQERGRRVFPMSQRSVDVVNALNDGCRKENVRVMTRQRVTKIKHDENGITGVVVNGTEFISADAVILAAGGASYPATGSSGDSFTLAADCGHSVSDTFPALLGLDVSGDLAKRLQGVALKNADAVLYINDKLISKRFGELLFTHRGLSGPVILSHSRQAVAALLKGDTVRVDIDLKPALDHKKLDERLLRELETGARKKIGSMLKNLLPSKMVLPCCRETGLDPDAPCHSVNAAQRKSLKNWLKNISFTVTGHEGWDRAVITAGGVSLKEIDPATLESKRVPGLYFAGECLDLDADTGGYNLQIAWSSGYIAGLCAAQKVSSEILK